MRWPTVVPLLLLLLIQFASAANTPKQDGELLPGTLLHTRYLHSNTDIALDVGVYVVSRHTSTIHLIPPLPPCYPQAGTLNPMNPAL